ncbi:hypothetical protein ACFOY2_27590 [Nonomuraea purpurea]|uniref:Uncharacterized protein n=1 Tax=Nonomuraea purpurea TaxID=1849276 RepID=A0ABV8GE80_9ACTN
MIRVLDLQRLALEKESAPERMGQTEEPIYGVLSSLKWWEDLIHDMEGWPGQDFYPVYEYLNELTIRDGLEEYCEALQVEFD